MTRSRGPQIGLDSQSLSYLLDAIAGIEEPTDILAPEKKALVRSWFYRPGNFAFTLTATVIAEIRQIPNATRREFHENFIRTHFLDYPVVDPEAVQARARQFASAHPKPRDCRILAEAEELGLDVVLTYDHDFWKRLRDSSPTTRLLKPSEYWDDLGVPAGAVPQTVPHHTNPFSAQSWWRW
jgi:predicted nucleic acid-binding protein